MTDRTISPPLPLAWLTPGRTLGRRIQQWHQVEAWASEGLVTIAPGPRDDLAAVALTPAGMAAVGGGVVV